MKAKGLYVGHDLDNIRATELRLGLPGMEVEPQKPSPAAAASRGSKRTLVVSEEESKPGSDCTEGAAGSKSGQETAAGSKNGQEAAAPAAKTQVVGWPPIRSYRKNCLPAKEEAEASVHYVKVSMDGAPYLRKIDLKSYKGYKVLREAMEGMFKGFSTTEGGHGSSEYVITYEDKDGDWMLAGDVPWEMFTSSCRRMRIMRGSEARGLGSPTP